MAAVFAVYLTACTRPDLTGRAPGSSSREALLNLTITSFERHASVSYAHKFIVEDCPYQPKASKNIAATSVLKGFGWHEIGGVGNQFIGREERIVGNHEIVSEII